MTLKRSQIVHLLIPVLLFIGSFSAIVATIENYGITCDENFYIENARAIEYWFAHAKDSASYFSYDSLTEYWKSALGKDLSGNVHPPFYKLSAIVFRYLIGTTLFDNIVFQYRVSTSFWAAFMVVVLYWVVRRFTNSHMWGGLGGLSFITVPRFFAHAHIYATDMIISSLGFAGLAVFVLAPNQWVRIILGGALFGAALASKFTGILALVIVAPLLMISDDKKRFLREYCMMLLVAVAFFSLFNFPFLFNPEREIAFYFSNFFNRERLIPITTLYFGTAYDFRLPFHQPWVMFGITLPPLIVLTAITGMVVGAIRFCQYRDRLAYFALAPFLVLMVVYMLPSTPKHDGIRLFSSAWPFIILLSIYGCHWLQGLFKQKYRVGMLICIVSLLLTARELKAYHPYELSYYNQFIGGAKGAQEKGFTVSYWHEAFNRDFYRKVFQVIGDEEAEVYSFGSEEMVLVNQVYGLSPTRLRTVTREDEYKYILVLNRILPPEMIKYLEGVLPLVELKTSDGAFVGGFYQVRPD